jgi:hypothetical protein
MLRCAGTAVAGSPRRSGVATAYRYASPWTDRPPIEAGSPCERTNSGDQAGGAGCEQGCTGRGEARPASAVSTLRRTAILHISGRLVLELGVLAIDRLPSDCHRVVCHARHDPGAEAGERRQDEHHRRLRQRGGTGSRARSKPMLARVTIPARRATARSESTAPVCSKGAASWVPQGPGHHHARVQPRRGDGQSRSAATGAPATSRPRWIPGPRSPCTVSHSDAQRFRMS